MKKNDITVIKEALLGEEFNLPKKQVLNNTIKINSNRNLNIDSHENICNYKLTCYTNAFDDFEIYFNSIFNMVNTKEKIFDTIKETSSNKMKFQHELNSSITKIRDFYKKNSLKEELFETHLLNKQSVNFGKISNFFYNRVLNEESTNSYSKNNLIGRNQDTYFEIFNKDILSIDSFKKYFLIDLDNVYDASSDSVNLDDFNINTYICQNLINVTRSLFTLHSGSLANVSTDNVVNISDQNNNLICVTSESDALNYFNYNNAEHMSFDYNSFYANDYANWIKNKSLSLVAVESDNDSESDYGTAPLSERGTNAGVLEEDQAIRNFRTNNIQKNVNVSQSTFVLLDNAMSWSAARYYKIYNEFYKEGSKIRNDGTFWIGDNKNVNYANTIKEIMKSFSDIYSVNFMSFNSQNNGFFNKWVFAQSSLKENASFSSDIKIKESNLYNSINFESITSKFIEQQNNTQTQTAGEVVLETRNSSVSSSDVLSFTSYESAEDYNAKKAEIFQSAFSKRFGGLDDNDISSISLAFLTANLNSSQSMLYYNKRPIYEVHVPDVFDSYNASNDYVVPDSDLINTRITNGSNYLSFKTDCIVKKTKINSLKKSNIDISLFKEISNSISDKITDNRMIAYSNDVDSKIVLAEEESEVFNFLFTKDSEVDNKFYSNFSITHNEEGITKFSNYLELLKKQIKPPDTLTAHIDGVSDILKNYYKGNYFKSSSVLLKSIISDVLKEAKNSSNIQNYDDISLGQYLYLNYFKNRSTNNTSNSSHDIVAKRFIKKTIEQSRNYTSTKEFKEFKFSTDEINYDEYSSPSTNDEYDSFTRNFLSKYYNSSSSLNKIRKTIFSNNNLNNIKNNCSFEKTQNLRINLVAQEAFYNLTESLDYSSVAEEQSLTQVDVVENLKGDAYNILFDRLETSIDSSKLEINFDLLKCVLPFKYFFKSCALDMNSAVASEATRSYLVVKSQAPFKYVDRVINVKPVYESGKISSSCIVVGNNSKLARRISISDKFDDIFEKNKGEDTVFGAISNKVLDMIRTIDFDFKQKVFLSEASVDEYIEENEYLIDLVTELLDVYSTIYCFYLEMLNQEVTLRVLSHSSLNKDADFANVNNSSENGYTFDLSYLANNNPDLNINDVSKAVIIELERLYDYYSDNIEEFVGSRNSAIRENTLRFSKEIEEVLNILTTSDVYQSVSFDLLMQNFNFYLKNNKKLNYIDFKNNIIINNSNFDIEKTAMNFFNKNYMNNLYSKKVFLKEYNKLFDNKVKHLTDIDSLSNINIFDIEKQRELRKISSLNASPIARNVLNNDFYSYAVSLEDLKEVNHDSIIKFKIEIIDHSRLDRIFLPKVLYFSPMLFANDFYSAGVANDNTKIGIYESSKYDDNRIRYTTLELLKNTPRFRNMIIKKFNTDDLEINNLDRAETYDLIIEDIYNNHILSNSIENIIDILYNIKVDEKQLSNKIDIKTYQIFKEDINNDMFFDLFSTNKDKFIESCLSYQIEEDCYIVNSVKQKYDKIVLFIKYLNNITSEKNDENILNNIENFINLNFNIRTNEFNFVLNNNDETLENSDSKTFKSELSDQISDINNIKYYFENISNLENHSVYKFLAEENIDNYSVSITTKVI
jgi:hypothetical protein